MTEGGLRLIDALDELAHGLVGDLEADACIVSRVLGDVLIIVSQTATDGNLLNLGQGFLVSDFGPTKAVLDSNVPATLTLEDPDLDAAEAALLRELGYATLLMTPLHVRGERWGLVEVYRRDVRPFTPGQVETARRLSAIG